MAVVRGNGQTDETMPATSQAQQQAAGAALAAKRGETSPKKLYGAAKDMFKSMKSGELSKFAGTKRKGLPKKKTDESLSAKGIFEGRDDVASLNIGRAGRKFARMTSKEAFKTTDGTDDKWKASVALRAGLAGEKPGAQMKSMDKVGKVPSAIKDSITSKAVVTALLED